MAHITFVIASINVNEKGERLSESAIRSLAHRLEEKYGNGTVKVHNGKVKVAVDWPSCICGHRDDYFGPEHEQWCPLWNDVEVIIQGEQNESQGQ